MSYQARKKDFVWDLKCYAMSGFPTTTSAVYRCCNEKFYVDIDPANLGSHRALYEKLVADDKESDSDGSQSEVSLHRDSSDSERIRKTWDMSDWLSSAVVEALLPVFETLSPVSRCTFAEHHAGPAAFYDLESTPDGSLRIVQKDEPPNWHRDLLARPLAHIDAAWLQGSIPIIRANDLIVKWDPSSAPSWQPNLSLDEAWLDGKPVSLHSVEPFAWQGRSVDREIECYHLLKDIQRSPDFRVHELVGFVRFDDGDENEISALVLRPGHSTRSVRACTFLGHEVREKMYRQVKATLRNIHRAGVVWGNAVPDNVLVDADLGAWVTDFGGVPVYVDGEFQEPSERREASMDNDLEGLRSLWTALALDINRSTG